MTRVDVLIAAAASGIMLGATGCESHNSPPPQDPSTMTPSNSNAVPAGTKHACKGQNACKGQGGCKSQSHDCKGQNACKGQGGCKTM